MRQIKQDFNFYLICFTLFALFILSILNNFLILNLKNTGYFLLIIAIVAAISYLIGIIKKKITISKYDIISYILIVLVIISAIFAKNKSVGSWGFFNRYEGLFSILCYYFIFLISKQIKEKKQKDYIVLLILTIGIFNFVFGYLQVLSNWFNNIKIFDTWYYARGFVGNSNNFGTLMLICYTISLGYYLNEKSYLMLTNTIMFLMGIIISGALSVYLSLIIIFALLLLRLMKEKFHNSNSNQIIMINIISFIILYLIISNFGIFTLKTDIIGFQNDINDISEKKINNKTGSSRLYIWKETLKLYKNYGLVGIGPDCFFFIKNGQPIYNKNNDELYDKAHNQFLQILVTEGTLALISYIVLIINLIIDNLKKSKDKTYLYFLIAYQIQAFFNIAIIRIEPINYILMGFIAEENTKWKK